MRVTSDLFVSALVRRVFSSGGYAVDEKRGNSEAGAIFVIARQRSGAAMLYGPASQASYDSTKPEDRWFTSLVEGDGVSIDARLVREQRFDPDVWIVEIEAGSVAVAELLALTTP